MVYPFVVNQVQHEGSFELPHALCADFGLEPARSAFTDDSPKIVAGAEALGLHAHRFTTPDRLRQWLVSLRLLPEERP